MPDNYKERAAVLIMETIVWDMTLPWVYPDYTDSITLPRFSASGFNVVSLTMAADLGFDVCLRSIAATKAMIRENSDKFEQAFSVSDIERISETGKLALILNIQETNPLMSDPSFVQLYYDLGVRHMLLAYNRRNAVADGCAERTDAGLSRTGIRIVQEMNRVGMLVDGTHTGKKTTMEAMELCQGPFIFSHSNCKSVFDHYRNIDDDQIKACAATGGVIGINGLGEFLGDADATSSSIFKHINHIASLVGIEHVGLALDYVYDEEKFWNWVRANPDMWPDNNGQGHPNTRFAQPEQLHEVVTLMLEAGYQETDVAKILGGNFARVARQVWK